MQATIAASRISVKGRLLSLSRESISSATRCRVLWDILERTQPGYRRPNFCYLIAANPLGG
jgi:hypothetical protein